MFSQVPDTCNGFFQGNPLLHARQPIQSIGVPADLLPQQLWQFDWATGILLLCFVLLTCVVSYSHKAIGHQCRIFFFPPQSSLSGQPQARIEPHFVLLSYLSLSLSAGLMYFAFVQKHTDFFLLGISPFTLYLLYVGCVICYFLVKYLCSKFINYVFFTEAQRERWRDVTALAICTEAIGAFVLSLAFTFSAEPPAHLLIVALGGVILLKSLLAFKCLTIFFNHIYLFLHLFAYLCTLEIAPLLALWAVLGRMAHILTLN